MADASIARMKDGSVYVGNSQFKGSGIMKWCALCGEHRIQGGGFIRLVMGSRQWVCSRHPKAGNK